MCTISARRKAQRLLFIGRPVSLCHRQILLPSEEKQAESPASEIFLACYSGFWVTLD